MVTATASSSALGSREEAEGYVAMICFKHGPPSLLGVELEWTVHHADDPTRPLAAARLAAALGPHAPTTLLPDSPHLPLPSGSRVTVEPGGQVEISSPPSPSVPALLTAVEADVLSLRDRLRRAGLVLGEYGADAHRAPRRILDVPRYAAMERVFDRFGVHGRQMMCSTASVQVCLDAGETDSAPDRWRAVHAAGPALAALFANSRRLSGRDTGWASARLRATLGTCPPHTHAPRLTDHPATGWARLAMQAPLLCRRGEGTCWDPPEGLTFGGWLDDHTQRPPTLDDLDYHLTTLFPPVRPRGHLEVRHLDAQPPDRWQGPFLVQAALLATQTTVQRTLEIAEPVADQWWSAARHGLDDQRLRAAASALLDLACSAMDALGVDPSVVARTSDVLHARIDRHARRRLT